MDNSWGDLLWFLNRAIRDHKKLMSAEQKDEFMGVASWVASVSGAHIAAIELCKQLKQAGFNSPALEEILKED